MPLEWRDIMKGLNPEEFNMTTAREIDSNPWRDLLQDRQRLE
jgi:DNA primase